MKFIKGRLLLEIGVLTTILAVIIFSETVFAEDYYANSIQIGQVVHQGDILHAGSGNRDGNDYQMILPSFSRNRNGIMGGPEVEGANTLHNNPEFMEIPYDSKLTAIDYSVMFPGQTYSWSCMDMCFSCLQFTDMSGYTSKTIHIGETLQERVEILGGHADRSNPGEVTWYESDADGNILNTWTNTNGSSNISATFASYSTYFPDAQITWNARYTFTLNNVSADMTGHRFWCSIHFPNLYDTITSDPITLTVVPASNPTSNSDNNDDTENTTDDNDNNNNSDESNTNIATSENSSAEPTGIIVASGVGNGANPTQDTETLDIKALKPFLLEKINQELYGTWYAHNVLKSGKKPIRFIASYNLFPPYGKNNGYKKSARILYWGNTGAKQGDEIYAVWYCQSSKQPVKVIKCDVTANGIVVIKIPMLGDMSTISLMKVGM